MSVEGRPGRFDGIAPDSQAQAHQHAITKTVLLDEILKLSATEELFARWEERSELDEKGETLIAKLDALAKRSGYGNRGEMLIGRDPDDLEAGLARELRDATRPPDGALAEGVQLVRDLGLQWVWVADALVEVWERVTRAQIARLTIQIDFKAEPSAPEIVELVQTDPRESAREALVRLQESHEERMRKIRQHINKPKGRGRSPQKVERDARLWCRHKLQGESQRKLALEIHNAAEHLSDIAGCGCRNIIRRGIKRTQALLDLASHKFI